MVYSRNSSCSASIGSAGHIGVGRRDQVVVPVVATVVHLDVVAAAAHDDDVLDASASSAIASSAAGLSGNTSPRR